MDVFVKLEGAVTDLSNGAAKRGNHKLLAQEGWSLMC